ncbi:dolichyl-diphosphooligosaccharide--protein glycosyltransferase subunit 2-like [Brevipalpus obovatus]|uniref:dolichyl-diphosphooligosaccharide--protein glycosyltransferase subunit 2-like n=1 Tax=Brevipalpus obovatus TaxID=246614 RepID=UPI003D9E1503
MLSRIVCLIGLTISVVQCSLTSSTYLTEEDKVQLKKLLTLETPFTKHALPSLYYSLHGLHILTNGRLESVVTSQQSTQICDHLKSTLIDRSTGQQLSSIHFALLASSVLNCQIKPDTSVIKILEGALKEDSTVLDLYQSGLALIKLGRPIDSAKLGKILSAALKKDDTLTSNGLALQLASNLKGNENLTPFMNRVPGLIQQADEVNGKFLQFEGGLSVTANVFVGIYSMAAAVKKQPGLTSDQVLKFTNYFLNRKTVQTVKGAFDLARVLQLLTSNDYHIPVCIARYSSPAISEAQSVLSVKITNVLGGSLGIGLSVAAESSVWTGKKSLKSVQGDSTLFAVDLMGDKPKRGKYEVKLSVSPAKADSRLVGHTSGQVSVIVVTSLTVEEAEIGVHDKDQTTSLTMIPLKYPSFHQKDLLEADAQQRIIMRFELKDKRTKESLNPHQVFVQFVHDNSKEEVFYIAKATDNLFKFDLNLAQRAKDFPASGIYTLNLIVGDQTIENPLVWKVCSVKFTLSRKTEEVSDKAPWMMTHFKPKPEIRHVFRPQEKRPPAFLSDAFSLLALLPALVLVVLWLKLGVNLSNFSFSLSALAFHGGTLSVCILYTLFWLEMDMFITIKYLLGIGLVIFLSGHRVLSQLANKNI